MVYKKKLIEVALPLEAINAASVREKSIRHGHPSTLHLWWARRPLAAARAVIWASLINDPSSLPEQFPTEEAQNAERKRLFKILTDLVQWENINNSQVIEAAKTEIMKSTDSNPPALLDPFAGGGSIPLEAQRLGLEVYASDLNPVAVLINKAMIEIPPKFVGRPPVNPKSQWKNTTKQWVGMRGLAEDVCYYGAWMKKKTFERIGRLYPKVKDTYGQEHTVIAWIWARTVKCPNPVCGCEMPLARSFVLSKKKGQETYVEPVLRHSKVSFIVKKGKNAPDGTVGRTGAKCIFCDTPVELNYIRSEAKTKRMGTQMMAVVAKGKGGRLYFTPDSEQLCVAECPIPENIPQSDLPEKALGFRVQAYGMTQHKDLFTNRQLTALATFSGLVTEVQTQIEKDGGSKEYAHAVSVYLAFAVSKTSNRSSSLCTYKLTVECPGDTFARQALSMSWDYAEANIVSGPSGSFESMLDNTVAGLLSTNYEQNSFGIANQSDAQSDNGLRGIMVSTDPPYYDNIGYADLSDYFYIWLKQSLRNIYPSLFSTMLVPKTEELIATPFRFDGNMAQARVFFETGMLKAFKQINTYSRDDIPVTVYYAFKQSEDDADDKTASTGWETMLSAIIQAGFTITGTWPITTERVTRTRSFDSNALASSIVLVCRKRPSDASLCTRREFINTLKRELKSALQKLQESNIAPVDLAQSAIGPGMGVYSQFSKVLDANGSSMSVRSALQIINQELDLYFTEQDDELDRDSRFCVGIYKQYSFNGMKFGEADQWARAKNTSVDKLSSRGVLFAQKGVVRLLTREEIPERVDSNEEIIWLLTQQLTYAMEKGGVVATAEIIVDMFGSIVEHARALAYRLFTIAERNGWAQEAYAYNSLVVAWPEVQLKAAELRSKRQNTKQVTLSDVISKYKGQV